MSRGVFTMKDVAAAGLRRNDPAAHAQQVKDGYINGVPGNRPAVISVNMFASALAVELNSSRGCILFARSPTANMPAVIFQSREHGDHHRARRRPLPAARLAKSASATRSRFSA